MALGGVRLHVWEAFWANLAPSWRPKRLQNRGQDAKKSMLKNSAFSRGILESLGYGFWEVFGWFLGPKIHAKSDAKKNVREPFWLVKTNVLLMSALLQEKGFRAKIDEKLHVFGKLVFERILGGFWEGFGRPKTLIFQYFSCFFRSKIWNDIRKGKKSKKNVHKSYVAGFRGLDSGGPPPPGERI